MGCLVENTLLKGGKYKIVKFIGSGGFGITYLAEHVMLGKRICIKEFFPIELCNRDSNGSVHVGTDKQVDFVHKLLNKFINEARILCKFNDINGIVKVSDVFSENETAYYVMDFIEGYNLGDYVQTHGPLEENEAIKLIVNVGTALQEVHSRNCLHLDIKPANIMVSSNGSPVLIDLE